MSEEVSGAIQLRIEEFVLIEKALLALISKNKVNAKRTETGYGKASSYRKGKELLDEAEAAEELINKLSVEFS